MRKTKIKYTLRKGREDEKKTIGMRQIKLTKEESMKRNKIERAKRRVREERKEEEANKSNYESEIEKKETEAKREK